MKRRLLERSLRQLGWHLLRHVHTTAGLEFEIGASDPRPLIALVLRRQRARSGLSLAQVAARLGSTSRNSYARYEQGGSQPALDKLNELLRAVAPDCDLLLDQTTVQPR